MKLIQRANKQLRVAGDKLDYYLGLGYREVEPAGEKQKFPCPVCGKEYASESGRSRHLEDKHPDVPSE